MEYLSNFVTINLEDGMGNNVTIKVSPEDADRAGRDLAFAQQLMEMAKLEEDPQPDADQPLSLGMVPSGPSSRASSSGSDCSGEVSEESATCFKWPHKAILLLVDTYKSYEGDLTSGKISKKRTWEKISKVMEEHGHNVSGPQCLSKFNGMKKTFKAISDHNSKSGNNPRSWPYVELMQALIGEHPFMQPVALASSSSSNGSVNAVNTVSVSSLEASTESRLSTPRKRKSSDGLSELSAAILESRRIVEENKNRRHSEKMQRQDSLLSKIDELLKKAYWNLIYPNI